MRKWFYEGSFPETDFGLKIKNNLYDGHSKFQNINIFENKYFGRVLALDKVIQTTEKDEFIYHEMLAHISMLSHPDPKRVLIIGGGDGGILREALKYPVKKVVLVEIDNEVIRQSKIFLCSICKKAFEDKRADVIIDDGARYVKENKNKFDVAIIDSSDAIGPSKILFSKEFYNNIFKILSGSGVMVHHSGSSFFQLDELREVKKRLNEIFPKVFIYLAAIPTYIGGFFNFLFASKKIDPTKLDARNIKRRYDNLKLKTKYYNPELHGACFILPNYIKEAIR